MSFWDLQTRARKKTALYLFFFSCLALLAACFVEGLLRFCGEDYQSKYPLGALFFVVLTFTATLVQYMRYKSQGGQYVAELMGACLLDEKTRDIQEQQLLNIVEEIAIASSMKIPPVYVIQAKEINAFAAGLEPDACVIAITRGALCQLTRDEMQAVIAHEFGHIVNEDMKIGLRLAAMLMGFYFILYLGLRIFDFAPLRSSKKEGNSTALIGFIFLLVGAFTYFFGSILKACVSREREYLADASSVQFTRNPQALIGALKKIAEEQEHDMPRVGMAYSHLYFDEHSRFLNLFSSHPPLKKRIQVLENLL